ncbi:chloride channel protein [Streptococcus penaeicida]|uniref:Chloride channel protein n=1 Tax=Streptococcus penaeicida TaxID=1765960 RepID=A0A2N8LC93_9STRE|nr:chloride channel protein [Streptococcus penaeicida]PND47762.1 chloride channel protein [Streptococcus penaeicida]
MNKSIENQLRWLALLLLTGITAGLVASTLTVLIHLIQTLSFGNHTGAFSLEIADISPFRRSLAVICAGLVAAFGWYTLGKYAKPFYTIKAIVHEHTETHPMSQFFHGILQLVTVSMGSPLGREGASREVSVALTASWLHFFQLTKEEISLLLACASGAALGAVYNAPLATLIFILENILLKWSKRNFLSATITSFMAVWTVRLISGNEVQYFLKPLSWNPYLFVWACLFGLIIAILIFAYKALLTAIPKRHLASSKYIYMVVASFMLAALLSIAFPQILGNGKAGLLFFLHAKQDLPYTSGLLLAKAVAVYVTFYAGTYGGKIAPSMMMGGGLGLLAAVFWNSFLPDISVAFAIVIGAALFLAIINNIPIAAIFFLVEITGQPLWNGLPIATAILAALACQKLAQQMIKKDRSARTIS